jgi:hypothetical protein
VHGDLELAVGGLVDVGGKLGDVLGVKLLVGYAVGISHFVCAFAAVARNRPATAAMAWALFIAVSVRSNRGSVADGGERRSVRNAAL